MKTRILIYIIFFIVAALSIIYGPKLYKEQFQKKRYSKFDINIVMDKEIYRNTVIMKPDSKKIIKLPEWFRNIPNIDDTTTFPNTIKYSFKAKGENMYLVVKTHKNMDIGRNLWIRWDLKQTPKRACPVPLKNQEMKQK